MKKINLFCFPFAGGSKYSYHPFVKLSPDFLNIVPLDIPGRGTRYTEGLLKDIHAITDDIFQQLLGRLNEPYAIYGHSMGTVIAYLFVQKLRKQKLPLPLHIFLSGRGGPAVEEKERNWYLLPKKEFREKLRELGGSPDEVLENEKLMEFIEPILRADFQAIETFRFHEEINPFDIPVAVMIGQDEETTMEEAATWQEITLQKITLQEFPGGHFFIVDHTDMILEIIAQNLLKHKLRMMA